MMAMLPLQTVVLTTTGFSNFNLRTYAPQLGPVSVICTVSSPLASGNTIPALSTGSGWHPGSQLLLINNSTITGGTGTRGLDATGSYGSYGSGGSGGTGGDGYGSNATDGSSGGNGTDGVLGTSPTNGTNGYAAVQALFRITLKNNGTISGGDFGAGGLGAYIPGGAGGGGGGGGGGGEYAAYNDGTNLYFAGGDGGHGQSDWTAGQVSVSTNFGPGGDGGYFGGSGSAGNYAVNSDTPGYVTFTHWDPGSGGPAGAAGYDASIGPANDGVRGFSITGISLVTIATTGTITGPTT